MHDDSKTANRSDPQGDTALEVAPRPEPLNTVLLAERHLTADFKSSRSERISNFFSTEAKIWIPKNYCRAFVIQNPESPNHILGFYTLSAALIQKSNLINRDDRKAPRGIPVPMIRIGFMGRDDLAPQGLGVALIIDAARRIHRNPDIAAWGIVLESEGGRDNSSLYQWYKTLGFEGCKGNEFSLYAPLDSLRNE
ncbi:hypothetical protein [Methylocapsa acidiphila]|uniref:hypothetical protein n=1 Tax=Methylocapsa acidiphila TaxID=133552 RepID=UPI0012EB315C|nr:hypothetical protein [Methylocapsa acidiphila]